VDVPDQCESTDNNIFRVHPGINDTQEVPPKSLKNRFLSRVTIKIGFLASVSIRARLPRKIPAHALF
jgi:hypothetical protein